MAEDLTYKENIESASELLNIQKSIGEELEKRKKVLNEIGHYNKNIEASVRNQMVDTDVSYNKLKKVYSELSDLYEKQNSTSINLGEIEWNRIRADIKDRKEKIKNIQDQINLTKERWNIELELLGAIQKQHDYIKSTIKDTLFLQFTEITNYNKIRKELSEIFPRLKEGALSFAASFLTLLSFASKLYESFEKAGWEFRKYAGMFREQAFSMRKMAEGLAIELTHVGVTLKESYESIKVLGSEMGGLHNVTKDLVQTTSLLAAQLGVSEQTSAGVLRNLAAASKSTMSAQKSMTFFTAQLSSAAGVPLNFVMEDIAKMSGTTYSMVSKMPLAIIKSAVEARKLNTTINDMAKASESILDFQNSVAAEMEASVLVGKAINLQQARELAYRKDVVGSTKEILRIAKDINFENLDVFQMQSFARATGRSVEELTKMLQAEREMDEARRSTDPSIQKQLKAYEEMKLANEATAKNVSKNLELMLMQKANQERMVAIQNQWNQLWMQASQILLPIIDISLKLLGTIMQIGQGLFALATPFKMIQGLFLTLEKIAGITNASAGFMVGVGKAVTFFGNLANKTVTVFGLFSKIGGIISGVIGPVMRFISPFVKFLGPLGWIITAFQLISSIWKNFDPKAKWFGLDKVIKEVLISPFKKAWEWISGFFLGRSPSKLGLGIVKGLLSVQGKIFDVLTYPFRQFLAWILDKIPGMKDIAAKIRGGVSGVINQPIENRTTMGVPEVKVISKPEIVSLEKRKTEKAISEKQEEKEQSNALLESILNSINILNKNLESGKIGIYIDGQLMSAAIARQTSFRGGYGMNTI